MRGGGLYLAVLLLAAAPGGWHGRADAQAPAGPARKVIARTPPREVVPPGAFPVAGPVPDLPPVPTAPPAVTNPIVIPARASGVQQAMLGTTGPERPAPIQGLDARAERRLHVEGQPGGEGEFRSHATATFAPDGGLRTQITRPRLMVRKTGPDQVRVGDPVDFEIEVTNPGSGPVQNVVVRDNLPPGLRHAFGSAIEADLGSLASGETKAITLQTTAVLPGRHVNEAVVTGDGGWEAAAQVTVLISAVAAPPRAEPWAAPVAATAALGLEVEDFDDPVEVGAETTYEVRVINQGKVACGNVRVRALVPEGMLPVTAEGPTAYQVQGQQVVFQPLLKLAGRAEARFRVRVRALKAGDQRFKVQLGCDGLERPVQREESTWVYDDGPAEPSAPPPPGTDQEINIRQL